MLVPLSSFHFYFTLFSLLSTFRGLLLRTQRVGVMESHLSLLSRRVMVQTPTLLLSKDWPKRMNCRCSYFCLILIKINAYMLSGILAGPDSGVMDDDQVILDPSSHLGMFLRRCILSFNLLSFEVLWFPCCFDWYSSLSKPRLPCIFFF